MRFTVRSLGGKLMVSAALTLLLCLLCFSAASWYVLKLFYEHEAKQDAATHLAIMRHAYQVQTAILTSELTATASNKALVKALTQPSPDSSNEQIISIFTSTLIPPDRFTGIAFISKSRTLVASAGSIKAANGLSDDMVSLINASLQGKTATFIMPSPGDNEVASRVIGFSTPVLHNGTVLGALVALQQIDYNFALDLLNASHKPGLNVALCEAQQLEGTTLYNIALDDRLILDDICQAGTTHMIDADQHYLTQSAMVSSADALAGSPGLVIVDIEPLYSLNTHTERAIEILIFMGVFMITLGVAVYTLIARRFFIRPIRRLQSRMASLLSATSEPPEQPATVDELSMLTRSFNLLSESINTQENESQVITSRMTDLLAMSDILISTLNLEELLKEIVSRLGKIMHARSVSLLLYGREMPSPWAVARWSDMQQASGPLTLAGPAAPDAVTVHADPAGDITMTATTKMAAIPVSGTRAAGTSSAAGGSGKRRAIRAHKLTPPPEPYGLPRPRIPRPALRDLDMLLARMVMQKQKIAYGEDVNAIYRERKETWARLALAADYQSVVAVPLFLQDTSIGAVMLYGDSPRQVTGYDKFLLTTAAIQAAMAIQNALLFVEVKDKNAALERANHLKSQFLATVTHELRTPLHSIISYGSLLLEGYVDGELTAEQQEHIQFMVRRGEDLSRLVDDMLDLSKIEADRLEIKVEPLRLEQSLQDVLDELRQMASSKGLTLTLDMEEELPMALADSHRIRQVLVNLVSNALKFTEKGGVTLRCALLDRYDMLRISVSDTGIGISPAALDYIFEAFRQADGSTTRRFGGTGLGLTIARKLIELQGGEVAVESIVGQGSTFSFTLPVAAPARVRAAQAVYSLQERQLS